MEERVRPLPLPRPLPRPPSTLPRHPAPLVPAPPRRRKGFQKGDPSTSAGCISGSQAPSGSLRSKPTLFSVLSRGKSRGSEGANASSMDVSAVSTLLSWLNASSSDGQTKHGGKSCAATKRQATPSRVASIGRNLVGGGRGGGGSALPLSTSSRISFLAHHSTGAPS